jgi:hypothetical protein
MIVDQLGLYVEFYCMLFGEIVRATSVRIHFDRNFSLKIVIYKYRYTFSVNKLFITIFSVVSFGE